MGNSSSFRRLCRIALWALPAGALLGCASSAWRETSATSSASPAAAGNPVVVSWVASLKCHATSFGCSLGGQQGGLDAQRRHLNGLLKQGDSLFFWTGTTFSCDGGPNANVSLYTAQAARDLPLRFLAPSADDLKSPQAPKWQAATEKPWVVSNAVAIRKDLPLQPFLDLNVGAGKFRVFNFVWPVKGKAKVAQGYQGDIARLEKKLNETPAGRVNLVILNSPNLAWVQKFQRVRSAHFLVDALATSGELSGVRFLPGDRIFASVRELGQAAYVVRLNTEPEFKGFFNDFVAVATRSRLEVGISPSVVDMSPQKVQGLWTTEGEIALLTAPD